MPGGSTIFSDTTCLTCCPGPISSALENLEQALVAGLGPDLEKEVWYEVLVGRQTGFKPAKTQAAAPNDAEVGICGQVQFSVRDGFLRGGPKDVQRCQARPGLDHTQAAEDAPPSRELP